MILKQTKIAQPSGTYQHKPYLSVLFSEDFSFTITTKNSVFILTAA